MKNIVLRTDKADEDLRNIISYIADDSQNIEIALKYLNEFEETFKSLESIPNKGCNPRYRTLKIQGFKFVPQDDYLIFYKTDEINHIVMIHRIINGKQDYKNLIY